MKSIQILRSVTVAGVAATLLVAHGALAQEPAVFEVPAAEAPFDAAALDTLVGPIALYPDDLVGVVLPASTYPLQIVQASRFLDALEADDSLQPDPDWDDSVVALLNYPEVLRMMDANIEWTWALGEAVLDQQPDVLDAIQDFRSRALQAGNLASNEQQTVTENDGQIEIAPAEPEVIYIPYYEPARVVVYQPRPVVYYYSRPYPIYYYPYPVGYTFGYTFGYPFFWGVSAAFNIGWHSHVLHVYHHDYYAHPYYGRPYYSPYYWRSGVNVSVNYTNYAWNPRPRYAGRPRRTESGVRSVASSEGRSPNLRNANYSDVRTRTQVRTSTSRTEGAGRTFASRSSSPRSTGSAGVRQPQQGAGRSEGAAAGAATRPGTAGTVQSASPSQRQRSAAAPGSSTRQRSTLAPRPSTSGKAQPAQRSYTGRPLTSPSSRPLTSPSSRPLTSPSSRSAPPTFSGSRNRSVAAPPPRQAAPASQPRTQPSYSTGGGAQRNSGSGFSRSSGSSRPSVSSSRASGSSSGASRSAAPAGRSGSGGARTRR